jgi:hypothetical protein
MARVRGSKLKGLGADARRQIREALRSPRDGGDRPDSTVEDVSPSSSKLHNIRTMVDGILFDSLLEARRYGELKIEERAGIITGLEVHKRFSLDVNDIHICEYESDFVYCRDGRLVVEDTKSNPTITPLYRVKKKLMCAIHGIEIQEVF